MFYNLYNEGENPNISNIMEVTKMKKFILIVVVLSMVLAMSGFASPRAVDNTALIEELEDQGFVQCGDVWTFEMFEEQTDDGFIEWAIAYFDVVDNHGIMTYCAHEESDLTNKMIVRHVCLEVEWDYAEEEFIFLNQREVIR